MAPTCCIRVVLSKYWWVSVILPPCSVNTCTAGRLDPLPGRWELPRRSLERARLRAFPGQF